MFLAQTERQYGLGIAQMASLNKVMIIGNVGGEPEMRFSPEGRPVTSFRVATNRVYTTPAGDRKQETEWFTVTAWGKLAEQCNQLLSKGRLVYAEGRLHTRTWDDQSGQRHYRTEVIAERVVFLDKQASPVREDRGAQVTGDEVPEDDLPF
jgi:single-strand DNA-binding protein